MGEGAHLLSLIFIAVIERIEVSYFGSDADGKLSSVKITDEINAAPPLQ